MMLNTLTCDMTTERLLTYLAAPEEDATTRAHLATCPTCRGKLARLAAEVLAPVPYRPPDLAFLRGPAVPEWFGEIVRRGVGWAQDQAGRVCVDLGMFFRTPAFQPAFAPARGMRRTDRRTRREERPPATEPYEFTLGAEELGNLELRVTVYRHPDRLETAKVVVYVKVKNRLATSFAGSQVEMKTGETTRSARTDGDGRAVFEEIPLAEAQEATFTVIPI